MSKHNIEQLSKCVFKVVEDDPYGKLFRSVYVILQISSLSLFAGQYPFLYVILGADKCVLIDTGTGLRVI